MQEHLAIKSIDWMRNSKSSFQATILGWRCAAVASVVEISFLTCFKQAQEAKEPEEDMSVELEGKEEARRIRKVLQSPPNITTE
jgi:hypothetical protein